MKKITRNDLSYYTIKELDDLHEAKNIIVEDTAGHFTSTAKNVENVLSELFTNVDNGKNNISTGRSR